jgi:peptidoglycan/xylan/chitin deacetylase (PgdA/CDA1 family)
VKIPGSDWAARAVRPIVRALRPGAVILLYHRVSELASDPQWLAVPPRVFAEHMEVLSRTCQPLPLRTICRRLDEGTLPRRAVAVTFDDGYADNLHQAKPILERYGVPASVFVTTGLIGRSYEFWWDELERILLHVADLPKVLEVKIAGRTRRWQLPEQPAPAERAAARGWTVVKSPAPTSRHAAYRALAPLLRELHGSAREVVLEELREWAAVGPLGRATHRVMHAEELVELSAGGLIEVGSHTVSHSVLARQSTADRRAELLQSKRVLEEILGHAVDTFSYPFGGRADYGPRTPALVSAAGYQIACANFPGRVQAGTDRYQLPRVLVRDWSAEHVARLLRAWLG